MVRFGRGATRISPTDIFIFSKLPPEGPRQPSDDGVAADHHCDGNKETYLLWGGLLLLWGGLLLLWGGLLLLGFLGLGRDLVRSLDLDEDTLLNSGLEGRLEDVGLRHGHLVRRGSRELRRGGTR